MGRKSKRIKSLERELNSVYGYNKVIHLEWIDAKREVGDLEEEITDLKLRILKLSGGNEHLKNQHSDRIERILQGYYNEQKWRKRRKTLSVK